MKNRTTRGATSATWRDHQIIYLQKILELSSSFHPTRLRELLHQPLYSYANVPYRIRPLDALLRNPKTTVDFDEDLAALVEQRVTELGADGKLLLDAGGNVYQVNLLEKLLVPLLAKLGNLVVDGGIWMNTQRPEWNDANNALVGQGLSMVTLYYMRRYIRFLQELLAQESGSFTLSSEVSDWLRATASALARVRPQLDGSPVTRRFTLTAYSWSSARQPVITGRRSTRAVCLEARSTSLSSRSLRCSVTRSPPSTTASP